jgi:hypothetical protein
LIFLFYHGLDIIRVILGSASFPNNHGTVYSFLTRALVVSELW